MSPKDWMEASRDSFHTGNHASLAKVIRDAMPLEQNRVEPARGQAGIAFPPSMESLMPVGDRRARAEEHTSELQSLMRNSYDVFCLKKTQMNKNSNFTYLLHIPQ